MGKHLQKGSYSNFEAKFILSKIDSFSVGKYFKSPVGRSIVAGYNWILTPASIFVGFFLKEFYVKFDGILN